MELLHAEEALNFALYNDSVPVVYCTRAVLYNIRTVLSLNLDERRGVQGNTSMRSRELPRELLRRNAGIFPVLSDLIQDTDIIQFIKVMKL